MTRSEDIAKARKIDTQIAAAWDLYWEALEPVKALEVRLDYAEKMVRYYSSDRHMNSGQVLNYQNRAEGYLAQMEEIRSAAAPLRAAAIKMDKDLYEGWSRFFLVKHIHSSQRCSSFRPTTRIGWLPNVSGLTEVEAVKEHGEALCTICFPSAPVELTTKPVDPSLCSGSGKYHSTEHLTGRENSYYSPAGYCPDCLRWNTITKTGNMRKHKVDETKRHA
jgi:hypothetical protein